MPRTNHDDFDRDAEEASEARVVNVTDEVTRFEIAQGPGSKPRRYKLQPYGKADSGIHIQRGYTIPTRGVGRSMIKPTIEQLTEREAYARGPRLPMVVAEDRADDARTAWLAAHANRGKEAPKVIVMQTTDGDRVEAQLQHQMLPAPQAIAAARAPVPIREEVEDQGNEPIDVDPDLDPANTPDPAAALPTVPMRKPQGRARKAG